MNGKAFLLPLARLLMSSLFVWDGIVQLRNPGGTAQYFASVHIPLPNIAVWISILVHLLGGLALLAGFYSRWAAAVLALVCLGTAFGVHLPAGSDPQAARKLLGADKLIGASIHSVGEAEAIDPASVDYALAGPAFETESKPGYGPEIGRKGLAEIARATRVPILAIGGLNVMRAAEVLAAGPFGIAVMGGVMRAADPARVMRELLLVVADARLQRG